MLNQQQAAQTRFANDLQEAKNATVVGTGATNLRSNKGQVSNVAGQRPPLNQVMRRQPLGHVMANGGGPQPVGKLGEFVRSLAQQAPVEQQAPELEAVDREVSMEEFAQSPALQEAVSRAKLVAYFQRDRIRGNTDEYAFNVLRNMDRY